MTKGRLPTVSLEEDQGYYIVSDDMFLVYGEGETIEEAYQDYIISLIDYLLLANMLKPPENK